MHAKRKLKELDRLKRSTGWGVLREIMQQEMIAAAQQIAENRSMTMDEVNFRRGAIWAAKKMLDLPERLESQLQSEVMFEDAKKAADDDSAATSE
jgi:hypothetical protein